MDLLGPLYHKFDKTFFAKLCAEAAKRKETLCQCFMS